MATAHESGHHEGAHRPTWHYIAIAAFLSIVTAAELGPLFGYYRLPPAVLLVLSAVKFFTVVAFFMHLWDDASIFTKLFAAPLLGAGLMVAVLMLLFHTYAPAPEKDNIAIQERYRENWNGDCSSWLRSNHSNRWYCASPPVEAARILAFSDLAKKGAVAASKPAEVDLSQKSPEERHAFLMTHGKEVYDTYCAACHKPEGDGIPGAFPPLKGSGAFYGDAKNHATIVTRGLSGKINVGGRDFDGKMPAWGEQLSDNDIAAAATYERNSWGNADGDVQPEDVASVR